MPEWSLAGICIFSVRHTTAFLCWGKINNTSARYLQAILNSGITNTKYKNAKNVALLSRPQKGHLITVWELTQKGRTSPFWPQLRMCLVIDSNFLLLCAYPKMTSKVPCVLILGLLINFNGRQISTYGGCE